MNSSFKILICTDVHLGFKETDSVRGNDTFTAFEEILQHATREQVDFILNAGDLFHVTRPSKSCMTKTAQLFLKYCVGRHNHEFQCNSAHDTNLNRLKLPMFIIHGNHDEPSGFGIKSPLDIFAEMRCINYIGLRGGKKTVLPVLLQKGTTKLAIYAIGNTRDERLAEQLRKKQIVFKPPPSQDYYTILMLHQDRPSPGRTHVVKDRDLPAFFDLVIWGHEHEPEAPSLSSEQPFIVYQPGSSVATSLSHSEQAPKSIGVLTLSSKTKAQIQRIPLRTVRPMILKQIDMRKSGLAPDISPEAVQTYLRKQIATVLHEIQIDDDTLPLVRLSVNVSGGYKRLIVKAFGAPFVGKVANPASLLAFKSTQPIIVTNGNQDRSGNHNYVNDGNVGVVLETGHKRQRIETLTSQLLGTTPLTCFTPDELHHIFEERVTEEKNTARIIPTHIQTLLKRKV